LSKNIEKNEVQFPSNVTLSDDCVDLLKGLLKRNPAERMSYEQFFAHPFILKEPVVSDEEDKDDFVSIDASDLGPEAGGLSSKKDRSPLAGEKSLKDKAKVEMKVEPDYATLNNSRKRYRTQMSFVNPVEAEDLFRKLMARASYISRCGEEHLSDAERGSREGRGREFSMDESDMFSQGGSSQNIADPSSDQAVIVAFAIQLESLYILKDSLDLLLDWRTSVVPSYARNTAASAELLSKVDSLTREILKKYNDVVGKAGLLRELIESEGLEKSRIDCIENILYTKALTAASNAAVDEMMRDMTRAERKYEESCLLLGHLKEGFSLDPADIKQIEICNFLSNFSTLSKFFQICQTFSLVLTY
jgi:hypothetical protein